MDEKDLSIYYPESYNIKEDISLLTIIEERS